MSIESAKAFLERVKTDQEFAERVSVAPSREERRKIAESEGYDFTPEELKDITNELSLEELDMVTAGIWSGCGFTHESECIGTQPA
jgi:predicted ribosomally synthesized peptide with nif11-like leader